MSQTAKAPIRSSFPTIIAVLGVFLVFYILLTIDYTSSDDSAAMAATDRPSLQEHRAAEKSLLSNAQVLDANAGKVRLPIKRAKELVIAEKSK